MNGDTFFGIIIGLLVFCFVSWVFLSGVEVGMDSQTVRLCKIYASQDHSGEIGKERLEKMGYLWSDFNWYESCMKNSGK